MELGGEAALQLFPGSTSGKKRPGQSGKEPHRACLANSPLAMEPAPLIVFPSADAGAGLAAVPAACAPRG